MNAGQKTLVVIETQTLVHFVPFFYDFDKLALLRLCLAVCDFSQELVSGPLHRLESAERTSDALDLVVADVEVLELRIELEHVCWNDSPSTERSVETGQARQICKDGLERVDRERWVSRNVELLDGLALFWRHRHDHLDKTLAGVHVAL